MDISPTDFRGRSLEQVNIFYDWESRQNHALLSVRDQSGVVSTFKLNGLSNYYINEEFDCAHISHCKILKQGVDLFLSLDPYDENETKSDEDNFCFTFESIERIE